MWIFTDIVPVLLGAIASMGVGFLWYSPLLFAKPWMAAMGLTTQKMKSMKTNMGQTYGMSFLAALVEAFVINYLVHVMGATSFVQGAMIGGICWLGFIATTLFTDVLFGSKSTKLFVINAGYQLATALAMGAIVGAWR